MRDEQSALYSVFAAGDARFDGVFFVGVVTTGIYCRPVCTARTPRAENCRFFGSAAEAERAEFRPCLRCRPELAPGNAPVDGVQRLAARIAHRLSEGEIEEGTTLESVAAEFHMSSRQMRRIVQKELGVSPMELVLTRRLLLAKQLLTETDLPVIQVAYASGFASLRRFNDAFSKRYRMPPSRLRKSAVAELPGRSSAAPGEVIELQLSYRAPFDWSGLLRFLELRALTGVERIHGDVYMRTVQIGGVIGWVRVRDEPGRRALRVELSLSLAPVLPAVLSRLRQLFDLSARPDIIGAHLGGDPRLAGAVMRNPGLRVPGAFDGFEVAVRAILGQQVTVKGATTLAGRFAAAFGEGVETPYPELDRLSPRAASVAAADPAEIARLGITGARARCIVRLAGEVAAGRISLDAAGDPGMVMEKLMEIPQIGPWTASYIAMRALRWPDAFPAGDMVLRKRLGGPSPAEAERISQPWRPWRSYATMHLWQDSSPPTVETAAARSTVM